MVFLLGVGGLLPEGKRGNTEREACWLVGKGRQRGKEKGTGVVGE